MNEHNKNLDVQKSQMQVLELQELDAIEAGMAHALWNAFDKNHTLSDWSTLSLDCL